MPNPGFNQVDKIISALTKNKKALTLSFVFLFTAFGVQTSHADYYPTGIQQNVSEQTLINNGWTKFYENSYGAPLGYSGTILRPTGKYVILSGKAAGSNTIMLAAAAPTVDVFTQTVVNTPQLINGTYWYYTQNIWEGIGAIGFAPSNQILTGPADVYDLSDPLRMSWHLDPVTAGWRLGDIQWLEVSTDYLKQVWTWNGPEAPAPAPAPKPVETYVRKSTNLQFNEAMYGSDKLSDPDGQLRKTVDAIDAKYGSLIK